MAFARPSHTLAMTVVHQKGAEGVASVDGGQGGDGARAEGVLKAWQQVSLQAFHFSFSIFKRPPADAAAQRFSRFFEFFENFEFFEKL